VSLSFPSGTIHDFVEALREVVPGVNVVLASPEVAQFPVSPVKLTDVPLRSAVQLLDSNEYVRRGAANRIDGKIRCAAISR